MKKVTNYIKMRTSIIEEFFMSAIMSEQIIVTQDNNSFSKTQLQFIIIPYKHNINNMSNSNNKCHHFFSCEGQASCSVDSNNKLGDPCRGTYKYTQVTYKCL